MRYVMITLAVLLSGCAQSPPAEPLVKSSTIRVTASDFCEIMRALYPTGKLTWSINDTTETITEVRRVNAAFDKRCVRPKNTIPIS